MIDAPIKRGPRRILYPAHFAIEAALAAPASFYAGDRKYVRDLGVSIDTLPLVKLERIGYSANGTKMNSLRKNYVNEDEIERVRRILTRPSKKLTVVAISTRGVPKRDESQGWCIESIAITRHKQQCYASVFYRQTDLLEAFAADLLLFQEVFDRVGVRPSSIRFHFASAYLSMARVAGRLSIGRPPAFLERLQECDGTLWDSATWYARRFIDNKEIGFGPADRGRRLVQSWSDERKGELDDYLTQHGR